MRLAQPSLCERVHHDLLAGAGQVGELHAPGSGPGQAVVGEHGVDLVRHGPDQDLGEGLCSQLVGLAVEAGEHELGGPVASRACRPSLRGKADQPSADG
jgi:hypothetical protein